MKRTSPPCGSKKSAARLQSRGLWRRSVSRRSSARARPLDCQRLEERLALASTPQLLDVSPGPAGTLLEGPSLVTVGNQAFFIADDGEHGFELHRTDGTAAGTALVKDINANGKGADGPNPPLVRAGNGLFFSANDLIAAKPGLGTELWKSDGTEAGTFPVIDIRPGTSSSNPQILAAIGETVFFTADDGIVGRELWKTDGTAAGTVLVKDIRPGTEEAFGFQAVPVAVSGSTLFFTANDGEHGIELWKTDGTAGGTVLVKDIAPGVDSGLVGDLVLLGETLIFRANDQEHGTELWKSDGSEAGTVMVADIRAGKEASAPRDIIAFGNQVFFRANDGVTGFELWKSNGSESGTVLVKDIRPGSNNSSPDELTVAGGVFFFNANDGAAGEELWKSDGSAEGTVPVADIAPGSGSSSPEHLASFGSTIFFSALDDTHGMELWKSDGTAAGTVLVQDIQPGVEGSYPAEKTFSQSRLFFRADDGSHGREVWSMVVNDPPTDVSLSASTLGENNTPGAVVGTFTTTDPDAGDVHTFDLVSGAGAADNAAFTIEGNSLKAARRFNFELQSQFSIRVRSTDRAGLSTEKVFEIKVSDVADEPLVVESVAGPAAGSYRPGAVIPFKVTLSRNVEVRGRPQLPIRVASKARRAVFAAGANSPVLTFNYRVGPLDNSALVSFGQRFVFPVGSGITSDAFRLSAALPQAGAIATGVRLDAQPPRIVGLVTRPAPGTFKVGQSLDFVVRFSEAMQVSGKPRIALGGISPARQAEFVSGAGSQALTFRYVVQPGDRLVRPGGLVLGRRIILASPSTLTDVAGNRAVLGGVRTTSLAGIVVDGA